jgi:lipoyl(octanoyl) transferase
MKQQLSTGPDWVAEPGLVPYPEAVAAMKARVAAIRVGTAGERVWLLQHPPLYTAGTSAQAGDLMNPDGFDTFDAGRGGQWTYHGPGQLVAYVMLDLSQPHGKVPARDTHAYVAALEEWLIGTLAQFGVRGLRRAGRVGVWVEDEAAGTDAKVAAIGVRITRWVSWHGVSLNVCPDLNHFGGIVPCGIREHGVTSLRALGVDADVDTVGAVMREIWGEAFG